MMVMVHYETNAVVQNQWFSYCTVIDCCHFQGTRLMILILIHITALTFEECQIIAVKSFSGDRQPRSLLNPILAILKVKQGEIE